ncbi:hypothetical protein Btru_070573 [Bulinus truncatus]|nr:hypothetical protein Btru_070573 [Bulinus truncatus]
MYGISMLNQCFERWSSSHEIQLTKMIFVNMYPTLRKMYLNSTLFLVLWLAQAVQMSSTCGMYSFGNCPDHELITTREYQGFISPENLNSQCRKMKKALDCGVSQSYLTGCEDKELLEYNMVKQLHRSICEEFQTVRPTGYAPLDTPCWIRPTGYAPLDTPCWIRPAGYGPLDTTRWIRPTGYDPLDKLGPLDKAHWIRPAGYGPLDTAHWIRPAGYGPLDTTRWIS